MVTLKTEPSGVRSMDELLELALALEHHSAIRYAELAEQVRAQGLPDVAAVFDRLAEDERQHEGSVEEWARRRTGHTPVPGAPPASGADIFDDESAIELATSRLASPYRVLSMAVRNEERAFLYWSFIAAHAETAEIREAAERVALEELEHVTLLRRARRSAYHEQRRGRPRRVPRSISARLSRAAASERRLAAELDRMAERSEGHMRSDAGALSAEARAIADQIGALAGRGAPMEDEGQDRLARAEQLVEDYLEIADLTRDEAIVETIQPVARQAILRLAWLRAAGRDAPPAS